MKRVTNTVLPINIRYDLNEIKSIKFVFAQGYKRLNFTYPSEFASRQNENENIVLLIWNAHQTAMFAEGEVKMDTFIILEGSEQNPETPIVKFKMNPSLFKEEEVMMYD